MSDWLNSLSPAQLAIVGATATLIAAVVAAVVSVTVAVVNGLFAARLARANAHRNYRRARAQPLADSVRRVETAIVKITAATTADDWKEFFSKATKAVEDLEVAIQVAGVLPQTDRRLLACRTMVLRIAGDLARKLGEVNPASPAPFDATFVERYFSALHLASHAVEHAIEAYVYNARASRKLADELLELARADLPHIPGPDQ